MRVGILGGGQLGRMIALAGIPLDIRCTFLDPDPNAPASATGELITGAFDDPSALDRLASSCDICTYEFENVPRAAVDHLTAHGRTVYPASKALATAQDRRLEKVAFTRLGIPTPRHAIINSPADAEGAMHTVGLPAVIKTCHGGYDGKGQRVVRTESEARAAITALGAGSRPLIIEELVPFDRELSIIAVRSAAGEHAAYPIVQNRHAGGILRETLAPAPDIGEAIQREAADYANRLLDDLGYVGVMALEMFEVGGRLLANEIAPRVHNSGHWTIEGAHTSQFENHLRAILGWPLGSTAVRGASIMLNLIGDVPPREAMLACDGAHVHLYGKQPRAGRKVGHVTVCGDTLKDALHRVAPLREMIDNAMRTSEARP